jgi:hypothetical protein
VGDGIGEGTGAFILERTLLVNQGLRGPPFDVSYTSLLKGKPGTVRYSAREFLARQETVEF